MTLSGLERRGARGQHYLTDLHNSAQTVWPRMTEFGTVPPVTQLGRSIFLGVSHTSIPRRRAPASPTFFDPRYDQTVWPTATKFGMIIHAGSSVFLGSATTPSQRGWAPDVPHILGPPACAHTARETTTKFCMVIKLDVRQNFLHGRPRMLTRDLFAVANRFG